MTAVPQPTRDRAFGYARTWWPYSWDLAGDDLAHAVELAADPATPAATTLKLPAAHPEVLEALLARPVLDRTARHVAARALSSFSVLHLSANNPQKAEQARHRWTTQVLAAPWLTPTRFRQVLDFAATEDALLATLPRLATHPRFTSAAAGYVIDLTRHSDTWEAVNVKEVAIEAVRGLGGDWDPLASVFLAGLGRGHGMGPRRFGGEVSMEQIGAACELLSGAQRATLAQLMGHMLTTEVPELVPVARAAAS